MKNAAALITLFFVLNLFCCSLAEMADDNWVLSYRVDASSQNTEEMYITGKKPIAGTFHNRFILNGDAYMNIEIDYNHTVIELFSLSPDSQEKGWPFNDCVITAEGADSQLTTAGTIKENSGKIYIEDAAAFNSLLKNSPSVSITVMLRRSNYEYWYQTWDEFSFSNISTAGLSSLESLLFANPLYIDIQYDRSALHLNELLTASFTVSGGSGRFDEIVYEWQIYKAGAWITENKGFSETAAGSTGFAPANGTSVRLYVSARDSANRIAQVFGEEMPLSISTLFLPNSLTRIESSAFANLQQVEAVYIPPSVTYIAEDAFSGIAHLIIYGVPGSAAQRFTYGRPEFTFEKR